MRLLCSKGKLSFGIKLLLAAIGLVSIAGPVVFGLVITPRVRAQSQPKNSPLPSFEVASIKAHTPNPRGFIILGGGDASRYTASNVTAKMLITFAYDIKSFQVLGGPGWINSNRYDIDAKVEDDLVDQIRKLPRSQQIDQMRLMLRALLADRFKLSLTQGTKELPVFALVVAKGGPKLTESAPPPPPDPSTPPALPPPGTNGPSPPRPGSFYLFMGPDRQAILTGDSVPLSNLVNMLSQQLGREILDQTGLKSTYTFKLSWSSDQGLGGGPLPPAADNVTADTAGESIFTALQEQLGLKLEDTKAPVKTLTIDQIEEPSPN